MPFFSVLIATYNRCDLLPRAVESVMSQTFADFEVIISDDCSTDQTAQVAEELTKKDKRIRYFKNEKNLGSVANSKKMAMEYATGKYCIYLCDDDYFTDPDCLDEVYVAAQSSTDIGYITGCSDIVNDDGTFLKKNCHGLPSGTYSGKRILLDHKLFLSFNAAFTERNILKKIYSDVADDNLSSDAEIVLSIHASDCKTAYINKVFACWVQSDDSYGFAEMEKYPAKLMCSLDGYWKARNKFKNEELQRYDELHFVPKLLEIIMKLVVSGIDVKTAFLSIEKRCAGIEEYFQAEVAAAEHIFKPEGKNAVFGYGFLGSLFCRLLDKFNIKYDIIDDNPQISAVRMSEVKQNEYGMCAITVSDSEVFKKISAKLSEKNILSAGLKESVFSVLLSAL
ncbi:glycosyltransferase family 2 protein [Seleniivibrio sp.]|uniref:glycosyltransferase family 2 protein n=1 Tax=Seleniivibrio sp. TaxID=2898801 RepID=UPI0025E4D7A3|nr:glycosyltransferase family 2 protein [Seleniivibrio sp.]MCD8554294.1 glycosyltransferase [Seleniivibrio sp.]